MAKKKKACRVCGKMFTPCAYCENDRTAFHYRTICCSRKCAEVYLMKVLEARGQLNNTKTNSEITSTNENESNAVENVIPETQVSSKVQVNTAAVVESTSDKPKRKYTKKKNRESDNREQIE